MVCHEVTIYTVVGWSLQGRANQLTIAFRSERNPCTSYTETEQGLLTPEQVGI